MKRGNVKQKKYGFTETESILGEWNYVYGWDLERAKYSYKIRRGAKGAAFTLASMIACQSSSVDMMMYYDARPDCSFNGMFEMFNPDSILLKGYYPFPMFNTLYRLGECVEAACDGEGGYICAARGEDEAAAVFTRFLDEDAEKKEFSIELSGFSSEGGVEVELYLLDGEHDLEKIQTLTFFGERIIIKAEIENYSSYLFKLKKL